MGNLCAGPAPASHTPATPVETAVTAIIRRAESLATLTPWNKILLQGPSIRKRMGGGALRKLFNDHANAHHLLDRASLVSLLSELTGGEEEGITEAQLSTLFDEGHIHAGTDGLTYREFLLAIAVGYLLGYVPLAGKGVDPLIQLHVGSARPSSTSFSQAEALQREGDTTAAAAEAVAAAAEVHHEVEAGAAPAVASEAAAAPEPAATPAAAVLGPARPDARALAGAIELVFHAFAHFDVRQQGYIYRPDLEAALGDLTEVAPSALQHRRGSTDGCEAPVSASSQEDSDAAVQKRGADATPSEGGEGGELAARPSSVSRRTSRGASGHLSPSSSHLHFLALNSRWRELDYDSDGRVSFLEFFVAFLKWIGVSLNGGLEDDEEDEEDEGAASRSGSRASRRRSSAGPGSRRSSTAPKA